MGQLNLGVVKREKTDQLDAFYLLLMQRTLLILFKDIFKKEESAKKLYRELGEKLDCDAATVAKFFNASHNTNTPSFRIILLDRIIHLLKLSKVTTWHSFKKTYVAPSFRNNSNDFIPIGHLADLSNDRQYQLLEDVSITLQKLFPNSDITEITPAWPTLTPPIQSDKLDLYLNTTWYIYLIVMDFGIPKIVRSILRIGNNVNHVETEAFKREGANDFLGTVEFDNSKQYLILNLKAKGTGERWVHMKVDVNTGTRPEIVMGQYQNIGIGGNSLHFSNIILEYLEPDRASKALPNFFDSSDETFSEVPIPVQLFLQDAKFNYAELPTRIYSLKTLARYVDSLKFQRDRKPSYIRIHKRLSAFIAHPYGRLPEDRRVEYRKVYEQIKELMNNNNLQVYEEDLIDLKIDLNSAFQTESYLKSVIDCDVLILLYFDEVVTNALNELAWAYQAEMPIIILTSSNPILPSMYKENDLITIIRLKNLSDSLGWLDEAFQLILEKKHKIKLTKS